jgi:hypothetical protein
MRDPPCLGDGRRVLRRSGKPRGLVEACLVTLIELFDPATASYARSSTGAMRSTSSRDDRSSAVHVSRCQHDIGGAYLRVLDVSPLGA